MWYQAIADQAFVIDGGQRPKIAFTWKAWVQSMSEQVYHLLLMGVFFAQISLMTLFPLIGPVLATIFLCWLYAFSSFEYKWTALGWTLEQRLAYFEARWPYFLGFGLPSALMTVVFPTFVSYGLFALLFPNVSDVVIQ